MATQPAEPELEVRLLSVGNPERDYAEIARADPLSIYLIANGPLEMSAGKLAAQAFQAALWMLTDPRISAERRAELSAWQAEGARVIVRVAETKGVFERVLSECEGVVLRDEGLTEVANGAATVFASWPVRRSEAPKLFAHKRIPLAR